MALCSEPVWPHDAAADLPGAAVQRGPRHAAAPPPGGESPAAVLHTAPEIPQVSTHISTHISTNISTH